MFRERGSLACPYFMPLERFDSNWPFPQRLPLGAGWSGTCTAPGQNGARPTMEELTSGCNIGYAKTCGRLPADRHADAVRFSLGEERDGLLRVLYACERAHLPASHGELLYNKANRTWPSAHPEPCVQRMAECYVQAQLERRGGLAREDGLSN
jgi:hypothetical protein